MTTEPLPAYDPDRTPHLQAPAFPTAGPHVPVQELFIDSEGKPEYRDKKPSYVADAIEKES